MAGPVYRFGPYRLEPGERRLLRAGEPVALRPKLFDTLLALVENAGSLVEKEELLAAVWPDTVVEEGNLPHNVSQLRKSLGQGRTDETFIETVPTRGYRFVAEVTVEGGAEPGPAAEPGPPPPQEIRVTRAADGTSLAWAAAGSGPPLVKTANWLNHLEVDWRSPVWRHLMHELCGRHTLVRYDERGNGLSQRGAADLSLDAFVSDLEAVVEAAGLDRFPMLGISQGCAVSVAYAVRHPERVSRMVLHGGYAAGWKIARGTGGDASSGHVELELIRTGWGRDTPAYRQMFASLYLPDSSTEQQRSWTELQRVSASPQAAARLLEALGEIDVRDLLPRVRVPTLVTHSRDDAAVPFEAGRRLAAGIPDARFLPLDSVNHLILDHEPAWPVFRDALRGFLTSPKAGGG